MMVSTALSKNSCLQEAELLSQARRRTPEGEAQPVQDVMDLPGMKTPPMPILTIASPFKDAATNDSPMREDAPTLSPQLFRGKTVQEMRAKVKKRLFVTTGDEHKNGMKEEDRAEKNLGDDKEKEEKGEDDASQISMNENQTEDEMASESQGRLDNPLSNLSASINNFLSKAKADADANKINS